MHLVPAAENRKCGDGCACSCQLSSSKNSSCEFQMKQHSSRLKCYVRSRAAGSDTKARLLFGCSDMQEEKLIQFEGLDVMFLKNFYTEF